MKSKKSVSMRQIFANNNKKNINININQNININSNLNEIGLNFENKEKGSKPRTENRKIKGSKMKTCILGHDSEKIYGNNVVLSVQLSKRRSHDESSYRMENLLDKNLKIESSYEKQE